MSPVFSMPTERKARQLAVMLELHAVYEAIRCLVALLHASAPRPRERALLAMITRQLDRGERALGRAFGPS